ncbi:MAG: S1C family serine protease, partial [Bryobacteraceae bacterium]
AGVVVTAEHALQRDEDITVILADGKSIEAQVAGRDPGTDLAVLKVETSGDRQALLGHAEAVKAGELALVVGRSPDSGVNASLGIVSANSGPWRTWRGGTLDAYIRLDAKLFPNSSGGAVVNTRGELIGIATTHLSRIAGLAIPVSDVARVTRELLEKGFVPRGYLGVAIQPVKGGLIVLTVEPGGPAESGGMLMGDILTGIDNGPLEQVEDLQKYCDTKLIGTSLKVKFTRGGAARESDLTVGARPGKRG